MKKYLSNYLFILILTLASCNSNDKNDAKLLDNSTKIMLVLTQDWENMHAKLYFLEKNNEKWQKTSQTMDALIGVNGLGVGLGLHDSIQSIDFKSFPHKKEGDGKSPAGIFSISQAMGYDSVLFCGNKLDYKQITSSLHAVDDSNSKYYNQIVDTLLLASSYKKFYNSFENLHKMSYYYEWIFRINHNLQNEKGKGSLIFFHIWDKEGKGSAGCTTVSRENMIEILKWIDSETIVIQLPRENYNTIAEKLNLTVF